MLSVWTLRLLFRRRDLLRMWRATRAARAAEPRTAARPRPQHLSPARPILEPLRRPGAVKTVKTVYVMVLPRRSTLWCYHRCHANRSHIDGRLHRVSRSAGPSAPHVGSRGKVQARASDFDWGTEFNDLAFQDDMWNFFQACWHVKDWVKHDPLVPQPLKDQSSEKQKATRSC